MKLAEKLIRWSPASADDVTLTIRCPVEISKIARSAQQLGGKVESLLNNRVKVSGLRWPGVPPGEPRTDHHAIDIAALPGGTRVDLGHVPWGFEASWTGCLRLSVRITRLLQG